ncbi:hypothetical protein BDC45DRAFT_526132, partial [Circinella umbellata]
MQQFLSVTIVTFLAFFILVVHGFPTGNTHLNKRVGGLFDGDLGDGLDLDLPDFSDFPDILPKLPGFGDGDDLGDDIDDVIDDL